jgi:hypothetical protein
MTRTNVHAVILERLHDMFRLLQSIVTIWTKDEQKLIFVSKVCKMWSTGRRLVCLCFGADPRCKLQLSNSHTKNYSRRSQATCEVAPRREKVAGGVGTVAKLGTPYFATKLRILAGWGHFQAARDIVSWCEDVERWPPTWVLCSP